MLKPLTLVLVCAALAATTACGPKKRGNYDPRPYFEADFKKADADHDELLTRDEALLGMPKVGERFDDIDIDKNERLNFAEVWSYVQWRRVAETPPGSPKPSEKP